MTPEEIDASGLIRESYRIEGISPAECRTIFLDWALKLPADIAPEPAIALLLETHAEGAPDHPMSEILRAALGGGGKARRRGGRRGRGAGAGGGPGERDRGEANRGQ